MATLIAHPQGSGDGPALTNALADAAASASGARAVYWLADGIAADLPLPDGPASSEIDGAIRAALAGHPVDLIVQPQEGRRKRLLIADMDSTMIEQECIDELADEAGFGPRVAAITERAMRGEIEFDGALRERVSVLRGLPLATVERVIAERIALRSGGRELVATMRANGAHTMLVSGGFSLFTEAIAAKLGFHDNQANELVVEGNALAGRVREPILGREAKYGALVEACDRLGLDLDDCLAVGDGANDLAMIEAAGTGVALHAKPAVAARADARIDHGDLTALLYLQGYRRTDFAV